MIPIETNELIYASILRDMSEGILLVRPNGMIAMVNEAAEQILDRKADTLVGNAFAQCFFEYAENDAFNQTILDAVYESDVRHENIVPYFTGEAFRQLFVTTSYLRSGSQKAGVIAVLNDISELAELRDAVKAMEQIRALNSRLELRNRLLRETFGRYLSDELVRQLLDTPNGLEIGGQKRQITILMSDLRGFTALSEQIVPQRLIAMLNHFLEEMTGIIEQYNGTIIEFVGDGILAIFGAPLRTKNHAADALAAAVAMQARMSEINRWNRIHGYPPLEIGIGVNTGETIVGNIGSQKRTRYNVIGSPVNLCGRIESYSVGGQILISRQTLDEAGVPLTIEQELVVHPKGIKEPLTLWEVSAIGEPYNVQCPRKELQPEPLAMPFSTKLWPIYGKHSETEPAVCILIALCDTGAILQTDMPLDLLGDVRLEAGGDLFGKIIRKQENGWLVRFTAKSPDFDTWRKGLL